MSCRVSLRILVLILISVVAISTAVISLVPLQHAAKESVRDTAALLRFEIRERLSTQIQNFFAVPMIGVDNFVGINTLGYVDVTNINSITPALRYIALKFSRSSYIGLQDGTFYYVHAHPQGSGTVFHVTPNRTDSTARGIGKTNYLNDNNYTVGGIMTPPAPTGYNPTKRPWWTPLTAAQSWTGIYVNNVRLAENIGKSAVTLGAPVVNQTTGATIGAFGMDVVTTELVEWFRTVQIGKTGRAVVLESSSRAALAGNWKANGTVLIDPANPIATASYRLATIEDLDDPLMLQTLSALGANTLFNTPTPATISYGKDLERVFVEIANITDPYGLALRLVIVIPERDFLSDIQKQVNVSIITVCAAVLAIMIIAFVLTFLILQPLQALEERMDQSATLRDQGGAIEPSLLREVAAIQLAYSRLLSELTRVKSFLPQSVLAQVEANNGDGYSAIGDEEEGTELEVDHEATRSSVDTRSERSSLSSQRYKPGTESDRSPTNSDSGGSASGSSRSSLMLRVGAGGRLNTEGGITNKKVSVMVCNLSGYHYTAKNSHRVAQRQLNNFLQLIVECVKPNRGVVDSFQGDHVFVTFNAVLMAPSHQGKACKAAYQLINKCNSTPNIPKVSIGISSGEAMVGNLGIDGLKRFCTVGELYATAMVLERMCKRIGCSNLITPAVAQGAIFDTNIIGKDVMRLPNSKGPVVLSSVIGLRLASETEEWMYDLHSGDPQQEAMRKLNEAFSKYIGKDGTAEAQALANQIPEDYEYLGRLQEVLMSGDANSRSEENMNRFYGIAFAGGKKKEGESGAQRAEVRSNASRRHNNASVGGESMSNTESNAGDDPEPPMEQAAAVEEQAPLPSFGMDD